LVSVRLVDGSVKTLKMTYWYLPIRHSWFIADWRIFGWHL